MASKNSPDPSRKSTLTVNRLRFLYGSLGISQTTLERLAGWPVRLTEKTVQEYKITKWKGDLQVLTDTEVNAIGALFGGSERWSGLQYEMIREVRCAVESLLEKGQLDWKVVDAVATLAHGCANREYDRLRARAQHRPPERELPPGKAGASDQSG
jgi:hypothetical protein